MRYLSFDIEATGLEEHDHIIEFGCVPINASNQTISDQNSFHCYIKCPSFETLKPKLNEWVVKNNKSLIDKAHQDGITLSEFKKKLEIYLNSEAIKEYFNNQKIVLMGKSLNAIDLPFLNRDLGWKWMRNYFSHRTLDVTSATYTFIDQNIIPEECESGSHLMKRLNLGDVAHTALEDSINVAKIYFELLKLS